jgi:hypothetical protein
MKAFARLCLAMMLALVLTGQAWAQDISAAAFWDLRGEPVAVVAYEVEPAPSSSAWLKGPATYAFAGAQPSGGEVLSGLALVWSAKMSDRLSLSVGPALVTTPQTRLGFFAGVAWKF